MVSSFHHLKVDYRCLADRAAGSRGNGRGPMAWDSFEQAGFTTGTSWMDIHPNHVSINAADEEKDPDSVLHFYRRLLNLRKSMPCSRKDPLSRC